MSKSLRIGSKGEAVTAVQRELHNRIAPDLAITGVFDKATETAVRRYQEIAGFKGKDIDGVVGPKTMLAIFQSFDMHFKVPLVMDRKIPNLNLPADYGTKLPPPYLPSAPNPAAPAQDPENSSTLRPITLQAGPQISKRDGWGGQLQGSVTFRPGSPYWPGSDPHKFYHGAHTEIIPQLSLGIPFMVGGIYTGQIALQIQPLTDWLVLRERWHLFVPNFGFFGQIPLNSGAASDPASNPRLGVTAGVNLVQFDVIKDILNITIQGQGALYLDTQTKRGYVDPSLMITTGLAF